MEPFWRLVWRWLRSRSKTKRTGWTRSFTCSRGWPSAHSTNLVLQGKWRNTMHCVCFRSTSSMRFVCLFVFWVFLFDRRTENWDWYRPCTVHRGVLCQFPFRWIYYCHSSESTGNESGKTHLCVLEYVLIHTSKWNNTTQISSYLYKFEVI